MNPLKPNAPASNAPAGVTAALLLAAAGSLLAPAPAAPAQTYNENTNAPNGDFGNSFASRTTLTLGNTTRVTQVTGDVDGTMDPDFFTFTGLAGGTPYFLSLSAGNADSRYQATFQGYNDAGTAIGNSAAYDGTEAMNTLRTISGTIPASGMLTIGVNPQIFGNTEGTTPVYVATLTAAAIPEPATTSLVALGAALAALATRRQRQQPTTDAAA